MASRLISRTFGVLLVTLGLGIAAPAWAGNPVVCDVTSDKDMSAVGGLTAGSLRQMLWFAMAGMCQDKVITIKVPKITMNAPLGTGIFSGLKGFVITPDATIPQVEITVKYDSVDMAAGCSTPSPFDSCFAYLPTSDVTIRKIKVSVDPGSVSTPKRGLCVDQDMDAQVAGPTNNRITLDNNVFDGFTGGGIFVSYDAYGVFITKNTFHGSGHGIVVENDPANPGATETPMAPIMGGSNQALYAITDSKGSVVEYHLRGLSQDVVDDTVSSVVELYKSDGKSATDYLQTCSVTKSVLIPGTTDFANGMIDGKWNIECVIPNTIVLPFTYAVSITRNKGSVGNVSTMTSMFSVGTISADVAKIPSVTPSDPQVPIAPPSPPIVPTNPPAYPGTPDPSGNASSPLILSTTAPTGGCSLIR